MLNTEINVNLGWFLTVWLVVNLVSPAMPPVSGGPLVCLGLMMKQFGIPMECLGVAATLVLLTDFSMTAFRLVIGHIQTIDEAAHFNILDYDILRKDMKGVAK